MSDHKQSTHDEHDEFENRGSPIPVDIIREGIESTDASVQEIEGDEIDRESTRELRDRWLRAAAELENVQKRVVRKMELARQQERRDILSSILEVIDSMDRALSASSSNESTWREGLQAIRQQMLTVLLRFGAEPFNAVGEPFDHNIHEAVAVLSNGDHSDDSVVQVVQIGYRMRDGALLRPAKVVVAKQSS